MAVFLVALGAATGGVAAHPGGPQVGSRAEGIVLSGARLALSAEMKPRPVALAGTAPKGAKSLAQRTAAGRAPSVQAAPVHARALPPVHRWLPSGTGMWIHEYVRSEGGSGRAVVARAVQSGFTTLYVRTGSTADGWTGSPTLRSLLPATNGTAVQVVAWDFPTLRDPVADAHRMAIAARFHCPGCPRVAAVAPDVETAAEGTQISTTSVRIYYMMLRRLIPRDVAILATVPWPSSARRGTYPYAKTAQLTDAFMPMAYWYNQSPAAVTGTSMRYLAKFHRPVMPVGQGYDGRMDAPYIAADPHPGLSVRSFTRVARAKGARAISLWSWQTTGPLQWDAITLAQTLFPR